MRFPKTVTVEAPFLWAAPTASAEKVVPLLWVSLHACQRKISCDARGSSPGSLSTPLVRVSVLHQESVVWVTTAQDILKSGRASLPNLFLFLKMVLLTLALLCFHVNSGVSLSAFGHTESSFALSKIPLDGVPRHTRPTHS